MKYKITWTRTQFGETIIEADSKLKAEEKAEIGEREKIIILGNDLEDWVIFNVEQE